MKKVALHNLGCKVNSYETDGMKHLLMQAGYEIVPFKEGADIYIINTCSVTNIADRKSRQMLHKAKKMNPAAVVVAAGCYVQASKEEAKKDKAIDIVVGNNKKSELVKILQDYFMENRTEESVIDIAQTKEYESLRIEGSADHTRAFIKVQDGCNQFCSYCIIPYTRGRVRSREIEDVVEEVKGLTAKGCQEIVLTGIHLSSYGVDFLEHTKETLLSLIQKLHSIDGLRRIRLGSLEPRIITEEFACALAGLEKICPHFHLSLQSGCNDTLKRMNRHYTAEEYYSKCEILRAHFNNPAITTDVIVGFPGETEEEFKKTKEFLEKVRFYEMHIFKYSLREGTKASSMPDQVLDAVKTERSYELLALEELLSSEYRDGFLGSEAELLLEEETTIEGLNYWVGHTKEYVKAVVPLLEGRHNTIVKGRLIHKLNNQIMVWGK